MRPHFFTFAMASVAAYRTIAPSNWPQIDIISVGLIVAAFLPYLSSVVAEMGVAGVFSAKFRDVEGKVRRIEEKQASIDDAILTSAGIAEPAKALNDPVRDIESYESTLRTYVDEYLSIRSTMPRGSRRTSAMSQVMQNMIHVSKSAGREWPNRAKWLESSNAGEKLAAVAWSMAFPTDGAVSQLLSSVRETDSAFFQYWVARAARLTIQTFGPDSVTFGDRAKLREMQNWAKGDTGLSDLIEVIFWILDQGK